MKLYQSVGPNPRVATMFIAEMAIVVPRVFLDIVRGENRQPPYLTKNPNGGTPLLETDGGACITDSLAICHYLDATSPDGMLIGRTSAERATTIAMLRHIDQTVVVPMTIGFRGAEGYSMFRDRMHCVPNAAAELKALAQTGLAAIDASLHHQMFVADDRFSLADILLFAFVEFGGMVGQPVPDGLTGLKSWHARVAARPSAVVSADPRNGL